jgi:hypothetical protein
MDPVSLKPNKLKTKKKYRRRGKVKGERPPVLEHFSMRKNVYATGLRRVYLAQLNSTGC